MQEIINRSYDKYKTKKVSDSYKKSFASFRDERHGHGKLKPIVWSETVDDYEVLIVDADSCLSRDLIDFFLFKQIKSFKPIKIHFSEPIDDKMDLFLNSDVFYSRFTYYSRTSIFHNKCAVDSQALKIINKFDPDLNDKIFNLFLSDKRILENDVRMGDVYKKSMLVLKGLNDTLDHCYIMDKNSLVGYVAGKQSNNLIYPSYLIAIIWISEHLDKIVKGELVYKIFQFLAEKGKPYSAVIQSTNLRSHFLSSSNGFKPYSVAIYPWDNL